MGHNKLTPRIFSIQIPLQLRGLKEARILWVRVEAFLWPSSSSSSKTGGGGGGGGGGSCFDGVTGFSRRGGNAGGGELSRICATRHGDDEGEGFTGERERWIGPEWEEALLDGEGEMEFDDSWLEVPDEVVVVGGHFLSKPYFVKGKTWPKGSLLNSC